MSRSAKNMIQIQNYDDIKVFIGDLIDSVTQSHGSVRKFLSACKISSSNVLHNAQTGKRPLTTDTGAKIAHALKLNSKDASYLELLVKLAHPRYKQKAHYQAELESIRYGKKHRAVSDASIHAHWLHATIYEMLKLDDFQMSIEDIWLKLRKVPSKALIEQSLEFLKQKKYISFDAENGRWQQEEIKFDPVNDLKIQEVSANHMQYLDLAKHRIFDDIKVREYQGLTVALPIAKIPALRSKIRAFIDECNSELSVDDADAVGRLQICFFMLTEP